MRRETGTELLLSEYLRPRCHDSSVAAVLEIRKTNKQLALTLGHYIKQVCLLNIGEAIKNGCKMQTADSEDFLQLCNGSWAATVASSTICMQQKNQINNTPKLSITNDLITIVEYVREETNKQPSAAVNYCKLQKLRL